MNTLIKKEFDIEQPIEMVWKSLANPEDIVGCVPGASITEKIDEKNYKGQVVTKFGPVKASYSGDIEIVELDEANRKMVLKGRGLDSKGKGSADMIMNGLLTEENGKTHVDFSMDITIVGMLAQFGSRLINDVSDQLLNQFVNNFRNQLDSQAAANPAPATVVEESVEPVKESATESVVEEIDASSKDASSKLEDAKTGLAGKASDAKETVSTKLEDAKTSLAGKASDAKETVSTKLEDAKTSLAGKASDAKETVSTKLEDAKTSIAGKASDATKPVEEESVLEQMEEKGKEVTANLMEKMESLAERSEASAQSLTSKVEAVKKEAASTLASERAGSGSSTPSQADDNSVNGFAMLGIVLKSVLGGLLDFIKGIFGGKK